MQHRGRDQIKVRPVQPGDRVTQVDRDPFGQARGQPQDPLLTAGAGQPPGPGRVDRPGPVDDRQDVTVRPRAGVDEALDEVVPGQPTAVGAQQQFDRGLADEQTRAWARNDTGRSVVIRSAPSDGRRRGAAR